MLWYARQARDGDTTHPSPPDSTTILTTPYIAPQNQNEQPSIPPKVDPAASSPVLASPSRDVPSLPSPPALESRESLRARFLPDLGELTTDEEAGAPGDMAPPLPERDPFTEEALTTQGANLGPSRWMASLPDMELQRIEETIAVETARTEHTIAKQERQRILHDHIRFLATRAALRCANHDLSPRARCVIQIQHASLINHRGVLRGVTSSANIAAGSRKMENCLDTQLERTRFSLELEDTVIGPLAITVGDGLP